MTREPGNLPRMDRPEASRVKELRIPGRPRRASPRSVTLRHVEPPAGRLAMRRFVFLVFVLLVLRAATAAAEPGAALSGIVRSPDGTPLPHLVLTVSGAGGGRTVLTGPEGRYRVESLTPGDYELAADAPGFRLSPEPRVTVREGETRLDLALVPAPVREHVVVSATRGAGTLSTLG